MFLFLFCDMFMLFCSFCGFSPMLTMLIYTKQIFFPKIGQLFIVCTAVTYGYFFSKKKLNQEKMKGKTKKRMNKKNDKTWESFYDNVE